MIALEKIDDGWRISETEQGWRYYFYPGRSEPISNNGAQFELKGPREAPLLLLPARTELTIGIIVDEIVRLAKIAWR